MSDSNNSNKPDISQFPEVIVPICESNYTDKSKYEQIMGQDYPNKQIIGYVGNAAKTFNTLLRNHPNSFYCLLQPNDDFTNTQVISYIMQIFALYQAINVIYCNKIIQFPNHQRRYYYPSSNSKYLQNNIFINTALFVKPDFNFIFNEDLEHLHIHDCIYKLSGTQLLWHCPHPLILTQFKDIDYTEDMIKLHESSR